MTVAYKHGNGGPGTCEMQVDFRTTNPNPTAPEDFNIDVYCGKPARWCTNDVPDVCDDCRNDMVADDPEIGNALTPAE